MFLFQCCCETSFSNRVPLILEISRTPCAPVVFDLKKSFNKKYVIYKFLKRSEKLDHMKFPPFISVTKSKSFISQAELLKSDY